MPRIATTVLVLVLLGGTSAAFAVTEALKLERQPVAGLRFDRVFAPTCGCPTAVANLLFRLRRGDRVTAEIVDAGGETVRTLVEAQRYPKGEVELVWDGRTDEGAVAPDGRYRLRLTLENQDRTILVPTPFRVDTRPPTVRLVRARPDELSPDGDGRGDRIAVVYRSDEAGHGLLSARAVALLETVVVRGRARPAGRAALAWGGKAKGEALPPGSYTLVLRVQDRAGNLSEPIEVPVRIQAGPAG